jgi:alpha-L-rhamnosidase
MIDFPNAAGATGFCVVGLKTEFLATPIGVETRTPRFSWSLVAARRNVRQSAYRVTVASCREYLDGDKPDLWDSGIVQSDRCFEESYDGRALTSGRRVFWRVWLQDEKGNDCSAESWFEMGLLEASAWQGHWLVAEDEDEAADRAAGLRWIWADGPHDGQAVCFRQRFELREQPRRAELLLSAKDKLHGVWVNGRAIPVAEPVYWGTMRRLPIVLERGVNVLCVEASALTDDFLPPDGGALAVLLRIEASDGQISRLTAGPQWRATTRKTPGWTERDFDDADWPQVVATTARVYCEPLPAYPARLLRRAFTITKPVARARLYATALGVYEAFVNGRSVTDARLAPEISTASAHVFYQIYDVTALIRQGANATGVHVGDGWYAGALAWRNERYALGDGPKRLLAQVVVDYEDGTRDVVATDSTWRTHASPVLSSEIYNGENVDARRIPVGWSDVSFDDTGWSAADPGVQPDAQLVAQLSPPIRARKTLQPVAAKEVAPGKFVYDFGQNFSGWSRVHVKGAAGSAVTLRYGEILLPSGDVDQSNLRGAAATDSYILRGDPQGEDFEPRFTYHGFRYVACSGVERIEAVVAHSALPETGTITVANPLIQTLCDNTLWSQRSNFFGVPTDCPQRDERLGWLGDIQVFLDAACFTMDTDAFIRRFLREVRAGQSPDGAYPVVAPQPRSFPFLYTAGWSEAGIILPWTLNERYGDTGVIDENWDAMCRWMDFIAAENPDWLWRNRRGLDLGDWLSVDAVKPADETTPRILAATAFWAYSAQLMTEMAAATGRAEAVTRFADQHRAIVAAFRTAFVTADGVVGNGSQTSYVLALKFGLVPQDLRAAAAAHLAAEIAGRGMTLSTGFLGTPYLLDVLCDNGQASTAVALLLQTRYPSWGYMIAAGATTMWERWNGDVGDIAMNSYSHYALGAVVGFIYRRLAGIAPAAPGFRRIIVKPLFDPRIGKVEAEYHSCLGRIASTIEGDASGLRRLVLTIPPNATAEIHLPRDRTWRESGDALENCASIRVVGSVPDAFVLEVGSGDYCFES